MPTTTPRLTLQKPLGADTPAALRTTTTNNAVTLDDAALFLRGALVGRPAAGIYGRWYLATDDPSSGSAIGTAWFDNGTTWSGAWNPPSRGTSNIAGSSTMSSNAYATMASPDQVTGIVLPSDGLIAVWYQATWQQSNGGAARAAIFIGSNQVKVAGADLGNPLVQSAGNAPGAPTNANLPLTTCSFGLVTHEGNTYNGDVATGQIVGIVNGANGICYDLGGTVYSMTAAAPSAAGGPCYIFAAAGTYTVSVRFKANGGSVTTSNRKLWVQAVSFG